MTPATTGTPAADALIGPGRLVLVVGPSGAGKDTILNAARTACASNAAIVFARRVVTRPSSDSEDHDSIDAGQFDAARRDGAFALSWDAHGLSYGIPRAIDADIARDRTVICNASRGIVGDARRRYANVTCVLIAASPDILAARLAARGRASDAVLEDRLARSLRYPEFAADVVIDNGGAVEAASKMFLDILRNRCTAR